MLDILTVAIIQREIEPHDPAGNLLGTLELLGRAAKQDVDLFVLNELWPTGLLDPDAQYSLDLAEQPDGPTVEAIKGFARETETFILAGTIALSKKGKLRNCALLIDPSGKVILDYAKTHLFKPMAEDRVFVPGDKLGMADVKGVKLGVLVCYEMRFPSLARNLAKAGCEIIVVPALWPQERIEQWETLVKARAIENQVFVVGANGIMNQGETFFPGHSIIAGPNGEVLNAPEMREAVIVRKLKLNQVREARHQICYINEEREIHGPE
jgi:omega-amidase